MILALLKNSDGDFDYPGLFLVIFLGFVIVGLVFGLWRGIRTGQILFSWGSRFGGSGRLFIHRSRSPIAFGTVLAVYCVAILLLIVLVIAFCTGWFRKI